MKKLFLILVLILVVSCKDNGTNTTLGIKPPMNCDTTRRITYNADIKPVIAYYCNCHLDLKYYKLNSIGWNVADSAFMYYDYNGLTYFGFNPKDEVSIRLDQSIIWNEPNKFMGRFIQDTNDLNCFRNIVKAWKKHGFNEQ